MYTPIIIIFIFLLMILFMSFRNKWIIKDSGDKSGCSVSEFGCCPDNLTPKLSQMGENCGSYHPPPPPPPPPPQPVGGCSGTQYGCCPDGITARDQYGTTCPNYTKAMNSSVATLIKDSVYQHCMDTVYKCCSDGKTPKQDEAGTNCPVN